MSFSVIFGLLVSQLLKWLNLLRVSTMLRCFFFALNIHDMYMHNTNIIHINTNLFLSHASCSIEKLLCSPDLIPFSYIIFKSTD